MKKRIFALLICCTMVVQLAACTKKEENSNDKIVSSSEEFSIEIDKTEKPTEEGDNTPKEGDIVIDLLWCENGTEPYDENWLIFDLIYEKTGVRFNTHVFSESDYDEERESILQNSEGIDIIPHTFPTAAMVAKGQILPISDYEEYLPNFMEFIRKNEYEDELDFTRFYDGKYYGLPCKARKQRVQEVMWSVRSDIFEKHNIKIPTNYKELEEAGEQLLRIYPDSTPITNRFGYGHILNGFASMFGTVSGWQYEEGMLYDHETGLWEFAPVTEEYKEFLEYTNRLYSKKILDRQYAKLDSTIYEARIINGQTFIMYDWVTNIGNYNAKGKEIDPDYKLTPIFPIEGPRDDLSMNWATGWTMSYVLPSSLKEDEEQLKKVLAYLDWTFTDEAETLLTFGDETTYFEIDGRKKYMDIETTVITNGLNSNEICSRQDLDFVLNAFNSETIELMNKIEEEDLIPKVNPRAPLNVEQMKAVEKDVEDLREYVEKMTLSFIDGTTSFTKWDEFVDNCKIMNYNDVEQLYNEQNVNNK